jgi:hypothetical protein
MASADDLRAEARHWRNLARLTTDERARAALEELADELDARAAAANTGRYGDGA